MGLWFINRGEERVSKMMHEDRRRITSISGHIHTMNLALTLWVYGSLEEDRRG